MMQIPTNRVSIVRTLIKVAASALLLILLSVSARSQTYTSVYNGVTYTSSQPYNLNVVYFVPNDVPLDTSYKRRLSELMIWGQNFYRQSMIANGFGSKSFGMYREAANPNKVKLILINGAYPRSYYPYTNSGQERAEVDAYFNANPSQKTSEHVLIITAAKDLASLDAPFYGTGFYTYAIDYPGFELSSMGTSGTAGSQFTTWYGGLLHELGHGLNLPHSHQTLPEWNNQAQGMNLMWAGNSTIGYSPTFINRAGCAILNNCQVFATTPASYYTNFDARVTSLHASYSNGDLVVSGTFSSSLPVTDVNIYQDPYASPSAGYYKVAWSVSPIGTDSFYIRMPVSSIQGMSGYGLQDIAYNLQIELVTKNGHYGNSWFPFAYKNNLPVINVDFDDRHCDALCCGWGETNVGDRPGGPTPGYVCYTAATGNIGLKTYSTVYGTVDAFPFAYTVLTGDGSIQARIKNVSTGGNDYGGVMFRNSLSANDKYVSTGIIDTRGIYDQVRGTAGASTGGTNAVGVPPQVSVKLQRKGSTISSFYSTNDGKSWIFNNNFSIAPGSTLYAGVFASNVTANANMDNVAVLPCTLPSGWAVADIGTVSAPGTACHTAANGNIHMESYGTGFATGPTDQVTYMYRPVTGNVNIVAHVKDVSDGFNTLGGLMLRNTLDANSTFVTTSVLDTRGIFDTWRENAGTNSGWAPAVPVNVASGTWLKISRIGNVITTAYSPNGSTWTTYRTYNAVVLNSTVYVGLVSAGMGQASNIDQVWINGVLYSQNSLAQKPEKSSAIQVLPNPTQGELHIAGTEGQNIKSIRVWDLTGRQMMQQNSNSDIINISRLPAAMYMVEVEMESGAIVRSRIARVQ